MEMRTYGLETAVNRQKCQHTTTANATYSCWQGTNLVQYLTSDTSVYKVNGDD